MTRRILTLALVALVGAAAPVHAQTVRGERLQLSTGPCTLRSGSGAPASGLGVVCDTYFRTDSPYTIYVKTGASTWSEIYRAGGTDVAVADGGTGVSSWTTGHLVYASGTTTLAGTATPSVTSLTATGAVQGATVTGTTSVTTPTLTASANLTLSPTGDIVTSPTGLDILPGTGYTTNIGALTNKYLTAHIAELWAETLVAQNTIATIGGRVLVGPTTTLTSDLSSGATSMVVKHNQMASGDIVVMQANNQLEWFAVTSAPSGSGPYTYSITRNLDGSGANAWSAGDAVFNTGTTGDGFIDLYSVSSITPSVTQVGPTIVGNVKTGTLYDDIAARWAIGNLNGLYGYATDTYGAVFGQPAGANITIEPTNGIRIRAGTTPKFTADASGNLSIVGDLSVGSAGMIRSGATSYASGTGYVLDFNSGTPRMRVGTTSGDRLQWDGANLTLVSANATIDSSGISISPSTAYANDRSYGFTVATGQLGVYGNENSGSGNRSLRMYSDWTGTGNKTVMTQILANNSPSSGGSVQTASVSATVNSDATSSVSANSTNGAIVLTSNAGIRFLTNGGGISQRFYIYTDDTAAASPNIRSDGQYTVLNASTGSTIYIGQDSNANVQLTAGGGTTTVNTGLVLNGLATCTLQVNGAGSVGCVSDSAAKRDIQSWSPGLDAIAQLRPVSYRWKEGDQAPAVGFLAQEVGDVIPEAVRRQEWGGGMLTLDDRAILAALVNAVKELRDEQRQRR